MARWTLVSALTIVVAAGWGCSGDDDDDSSSSNGGSTSSGGSSSGDAGDTGSAGDSNAGGAGPDGQQNVTCNPTGDGACQNEADCPIVRAGTARTATQQCGQGCLGDDDAEQCSTNCVVAETGLTSECAACYVGVVTCAMQNCLTDCAVDPASDACTQCQVAAGCRDAFDTCSGLTTSG